MPPGRVIVSAPMADEKNGPPKRTKRGNTAPGFGSSQ